MTAQQAISKALFDFGADEVGMEICKAVVRELSDQGYMVVRKSKYFRRGEKA